MAFEFSLQTVLRVRMILEEREERALQKILIDMVQCQQDIASLDKEMRRSNSERKDSTLVKNLGRTVHGQYGEMEELKRVRQLLSAQLDELEGIKDLQLKAYYAARQNRELLSEMRASNHGIYSTDMARREQSTLDDNFIARRAMS